MNPVLLTTASATADSAPENAVISAPESAESGKPFSLQAGVSIMAERLRGAKVSQQHASKTSDQVDPAAMQALMAMLLAQPSQPAVQTGWQQSPDAGMLKMLAMTQAGSTASLPTKMQELLTSLTQNLAQDTQQAKPEQQAKLAAFSAQDLHAISPEQQGSSPSQQILSTGRALEPRPQAVKKEGVVKVETPATTQTLLNVAAQDNLRANTITDRSVMSSHTAVPVEISTDELGEKLTALLKDRIQFQLGQQQQISIIRLDPPSLGKLEIAVQLDAGKLTVHIGANQSDVCRSLQQFSDNLRQHLTAQNFMEVNVQVSSEGQSQQRQQQQQSSNQKHEVLSALTLDDEPHYQQNESVLIKV